MKTYQVGVVGSGFMGKAHTYAYTTIPYFYREMPIAANLRSICSLPLAEAGKAAADYGYKLATDNLDEFFDSDLDIVHVCSPNDTHREVVLEAIRRGIHVYCEKPVAPDYESAKEIQAALSGPGLPLAPALAGMAGRAPAQHLHLPLRRA